METMNAIVSGFADVLVLIALFGLAVFVHEFGHFMAARWCGLVVEVFSLGFGPAIWKKKVNGTTYKIGWIPVGGYVALPQLDPSGMSAIQGGTTDEKKTDTASEEAEEKPVDYPPIALWKKIVVSVAGPLGNVVLAVVLAWIIFFSPTEKEIEKGSTVVGYVFTNSPAYKLGMRPGDTITAVNGRLVASWAEYMTECHLAAASDMVTLTFLSQSGEHTMSLATERVKDSSLKIVPGVERFTLCVIADVHQDSPAGIAGLQPGDIVNLFNGSPVFSDDHFRALVAANPLKELNLTVERSGKPVEIKVTPLYNHTRVPGRALIGTDLSPDLKAGGVPWMEHKEPWDQLKGDAKAIRRILSALGSREQAGQAAGALGGPVLIFLTLWTAIKTSLLNAVGFIRFLCVNLAILNLLPLPVLDGGHIVFALWEMVTRRKPHPKVVGIMVNTFACLLIAAFLFLTFRDVKLLPRILGSMGRRNAAAAQVKNAANPGEFTNTVLSADWTTNAVPPEESKPGT